jgi:putative ABC transport system permease protein
LTANIGFSRFLLIAIRKALGAGTGQLIRQFTVEGLLLSFLGAVFGLGLAFASLKLMVAAGTASIPRASEVSIDPPVLAMTLSVSFAIALLLRGQQQRYSVLATTANG